MHPHCGRRLTTQRANNKPPCCLCYHGNPAASSQQLFSLSLTSSNLSYVAAPFRVHGIYCYVIRRYNNWIYRVSVPLSTVWNIVSLQYSAQVSCITCLASYCNVMYRNILPKKKYCKARQTFVVHIVCKRNYNNDRNNKRM